ncbi:unnamed protein product [Hydatigera taeniaeformis]|uniref:Aa_trans domain-containing protein n=1 Tax=Hydatigena taeniaeformis TaxID=6205 RepID=A0A0R3XAC1_HYDTA|nr:unnamed protein product [Hydatigera taeniaeformis]
MCHKSSNEVGNTFIRQIDGRIVTDGLINIIRKFNASALPPDRRPCHAVQVLLDPALWETAINLPPNHGVLGLLLATSMAFCIPTALGVVCGLGFQALESAFFNAALLNETQKASGLVLFSTPIHLLDKSGLWVMFIIILLLLVTSCMFSIVGASSILYHDVLATYIKPFKRQAERTKTCLLCGKRRGHLASQRNICRCRSMLECEACHTDTWLMEECRNRPATTLTYGCQIHGAFRAYTDEISKSVLKISFTVMAGMIPIFIILPDVGVANILCFGICAPFVGCLCLSIVWTRLSRVALLTGYFVSAAGSLALWFAIEYASLLV